MKNDFDISNVRDALSAFTRLIKDTHKKVYDGIFNTLETGLSKLGDTSQNQTKAVKDFWRILNYLDNFLYIFHYNSFYKNHSNYICFCKMVCVYRLLTYYHSISFILFFFKNSFVLENGLLPKKPLFAENGDGWGDSII